MHKNFDKELEEIYSWLKLGEVKGVVKAKSACTIRDQNKNLEGLDFGVLPANCEFSGSFKVTYNLSEPMKLTRLFIRVTGPETIFAAKHFLEEVFYNLLIEISIEKERQEVLFVENGKLNQKEFVLMGEIRDWMMYYWKGWNVICFDYADKIPVDVVIHGKTGVPHKDDVVFALQMHVKMESL